MSNTCFVGFKPTDYQYDTIKIIDQCRNTGSIISVLACRQVGKSLLNLNILFNESLNFKNKTSMYIAPTYKQSKKIYKEMIKSVGDSNIIQSANTQDMIITFINGSQIIFGSAAQGDALRGYTVSGILIIDEARDISDDLFFSVLHPMVRVHKATILLTSTPRYKSGFFFTCYQKGNVITRYKSINYTDYDLSRFLTKEYIEDCRINLPNSAFITEVLGDFLDNNSTVFGDLKKCFVNEVKDRKITHVGIDWSLSTGNDNNVVTGLNSNCELVDQYIINNTTPTDTINKIANYLNKLGSHKINVVAELNSMGTVYFDLLKNKLNRNINIQGFNTSNTSKNAIINQLQVSIENGEFKLLKSEKELISEMKTFVADYNAKTRVIKYGAISGCKDDRVMSLAFAMECFVNIKNKAVYIYNVL